MKKVLIGFSIIAFCSVNLFAQSGSTTAIRMQGPSKIEKANGNVSAYMSRLAQANMEQVSQGKFTVLLNPLTNGQYELQIYRMVPIGNRRVMSTFSSVFKAGVEYSYEFDASNGSIKQHHYICPPDSLTCWSNPGDFASMSRFNWNETFPAKNCSQPVFTSEEYGREYLQASCFPNRDSALAFAQSFIQYVTGRRGL
jgi:hypothetical protein